MGRARPAASAERAGKNVAQVEWVGGANSRIAGPTVDNFFSTRGVLAAPLNTTEQNGAAAFGISYQVARFLDLPDVTASRSGPCEVTPRRMTWETLGTKHASALGAKLRHLGCRASFGR